MQFFAIETISAATFSAISSSRCAAPNGATPYHARDLRRRLGRLAQLWPAIST
jgi:hypothetical protein